MWVVPSCRDERFFKYLKQQTDGWTDSETYRHDEARVAIRKMIEQMDQGTYGEETRT
jgi:hypothetical protein